VFMTLLLKLRAEGSHAAVMRKVHDTAMQHCI
jgi:hypothetical protein